MSTHSSTIVAAAAVLALGASTGLASAQGYGSASGTAAALGFTASPPVASNSNVPVVATPAYEPVATGSLVHRDRSWTRLQRR